MADAVALTYADAAAVDLEGDAPTEVGPPEMAPGDHRGNAWRLRCWLKASGSDPYPSRQTITLWMRHRGLSGADARAAAMAFYSS